MRSARVSERAFRWALAALIVCAALAAFSPALDNGFVGWDDDRYLLANRAFRGLAWANLRWMATTPYQGLYQPLTWLSFAVDHALWGLEPAGYHLTNVLLHAASALLAFAALRRLLRAAGVHDARAALLGSAAGALLWAVHPLRVESVVWATERKDALSGALWLGALVAYLDRRVAAALALFMLSLSAKTTAASLAPLLVLLDLYPLRRRAWLEKLPFAAAAAAAAAASAWALRAAGQLDAAAGRGLAWRLGQAAYGLWFYALKTCVPFGLLPYYPPADWFGRWWPQAALLLGAAGVVAASAWALRRRAPAAAACCAAYALLAAPTLGLVQTTVPWRACDRYSYLPALAFSALLAAAVARASQRRAAPLAAAAAAAALGVLSWRQAGVWRDSETLWSHAVAGEPRGALSLRNLAVARAEAGRPADALALLERAAAAAPGDPDVDEALGAALLRAGRRAEAEAALRRGLAAAPRSAILNVRLGELLAEDTGPRLAEGLERLRAAAAAGAPSARARLANALLRAGAPADSEREYRLALSEDPSDGAARSNLGLILQRRGALDEALAQYRLALQQPQARPQAHYNWGNLLLEQGRLERAAFHYAEAVRLAPGLVKAQVNWGNALARQGRLSEAAGRYRAALKKDPGSFEARVNLATALRLLRR